MRILIGIVIGIVIADIGTEKVFNMVGHTLQQFVDIIKSLV
jgi:hypothetical protein